MYYFDFREESSPGRLVVHLDRRTSRRQVCWESSSQDQSRLHRALARNGCGRPSSPNYSSVDSLDNVSCRHVISSDESDSNSQPDLVGHLAAGRHPSHSSHETASGRGQRLDSQGPIVCQQDRSSSIDSFTSLSGSRSSVSDADSSTISSCQLDFDSEAKEWENLLNHLQLLRKEVGMLNDIDF